MRLPRKHELLAQSPGMEEPFTAAAERAKETNGAFLEKLLAEHEARGASLDKGVVPVAEAWKLGVTPLGDVWAKRWCSGRVRPAHAREALHNKAVPGTAIRNVRFQPTLPLGAGRGCRSPPE